MYTTSWLPLERPWSRRVFARGPVRRTRRRSAPPTTTSARHLAWGCLGYDAAAARLVGEGEEGDAARLPLRGLRD
uniref:Uncharacterized protein n=1 Tax=Oryza glumipatula TaxID=40148 RepID=A0A0E0ACU8_9ORYZ